MDHHSHGRAAWLIDAAAAMVLALSAGFAGLWLSGAAVALIVGIAALAVALAVLRGIRPAPPRFTLARFALARPSLVDWDEVFAADGQPDEPELLLDCPAPAAAVPFRSVFPTAGELYQRIETHLAEPQRDRSSHAPSAQVVQLGADASAALRSALLDLRRSL